MSPHWYDRDKGQGVKAFQDAQAREAAPEPTPEREHIAPRPPQPMLTPTGPIRDAVDRAVIEQREAEITKRAEALREKFAAQRTSDRGREI